MHRYYYNLKHESKLVRWNRKYGWTIWPFMLIVLFFDDTYEQPKTLFRILFVLIVALINFPWKKIREPFVELDDTGISTILPYGQEYTKLEWKDVTKVFYTTDGGISFYHGSDFTFFIPLRQLAEADKNSLIEIVKQKLSPGVMGLEKL